MGNRKVMLIATVVVLGVVGAVVFFVTQKPGSSSMSAKDGNSNNDDNNASSAGRSTDGKTGGESTAGGTESNRNTRLESGGSSGSEATKAPKEYTDPTAEQYSLAAYAIGDWGATLGKDSCCVRRKTYTPVDRHANEAIAKLMGIVADNAEVKPNVVMGHGDSFYWMGIMSADEQQYRFENTFESKYSSPSLIDVPWVNVMGNHDYGGASFVCSTSEGPVECSDTNELLEALDNKLKWQAEYKSHNNDRWMLKDRFYSYVVKDDASNVSIEIFNVDTNDADSHGASQICCQCYGYSGGSKTACKGAGRGHKYCAGGNTGMYDACMQKIKGWGKEVREKLVEAAKASTATWKIINSHYSPYNHYTPYNADMWKDLLSGLGVQLWINGHTHGSKHDFGNFDMHFIENGAGGGIQNESPSGIPPYAESYMSNIWSAGGYPYGFFDLTASQNWLKVRFLTLDNGWHIEEDDFDNAKVGGAAVPHCWYIPVDGTKGKACNE